jgi:RNA polymerase sigma-70 factor (ECF subfamily)
VAGPLTNSREAGLIRAARAGNTVAYAELVKAFERIVYRTASFICGPNDADEVAQLAYIKAYHALHRFQIGRPFQPWLLQIVVNEAKTARRGETRRSAIVTRALNEPGPTSNDHRPDQHAAQMETHEELKAALRRLPHKQRDVVACRYLLELSEEETAQILGLRPGTVKSRLSRALDRLRTELELSTERNRSGEAGTRRSPERLTNPVREPGRRCQVFRMSHSSE